MHKRYTQYIWHVLAVIWMGLIFFFSHQPADSSDRQSGFFVSLLEPITPVADTSLLSFLTRKAAHITIYFILGVLIYGAVRKHTSSRKKAILISIGAVLGYAALDEIHQLFIPGRSGEVRDVIIDTIAGTAGVFLHALIRKPRQK